MLKFIRNALSTSMKAGGNAEKIPLPPLPLQQFVGGDFTAVGKEFVDHLKNLCSLGRDDAVLDIGCGSGRIALPLTSYLSKQGKYRGFDVSREAVQWCRRNISRRFPNFEFLVANVKNGPYNPSALLNPAEYQFPYADHSFDVVFLASVFTHMFPADLKNYLREIYRVLKPSGRCLATFFILNEESVRLMSGNEAKLNFRYSGEGYRTINEKTPEEGLAYPESFVRTSLTEVGLTLKEPIFFGSWCGRPEYWSFQDITIATK